jgi:hypothetical protein
MLPLSLSQLSLNNMGLLNQKKDPFSDPNKMGLLGAALSLLENSGPSTTPTSLGQVIGRAGMGGLQMRQQAIAGQNAQAEADFNRQYKQAQMDSMLKNNGIIGDLTPGNYTPESLALFAEDYQKNMKPNYALLKESVNPFTVGGIRYIPGQNGALAPAVDPNTVAQTAGQIAGAEAAGTASGKATTEAALDLPRVEDNAKNTLGLIDQVLNHPGLSISVGKSSVMKPELIPGSDAADFVAKVNQLQGKQFLEAYQSLRGGGTITETEGLKAETALNNLARSQSEEQYKTNLNELRTIISQGVERAKKKAGQSSGEIKFLGFE